MPTDHVIDASAAARLIIDGPHTHAFRRWFANTRRRGDRMLAPHLIGYELASAASRSLHQPADPERARAVGSAIERLLFHIELTPVEWSSVLSWTDRLTAYDAAYAAAADRLGATLVTSARRLAAAVSPRILVLSPGITLDTS